MSYAVPQGVDLEDKIIGSITMKQLGILGLGGGICYVAYTKMDAFIWPFVVGIVAPLTLAFAFVRIYEMTFFQLLMSFVSYYMKPEKRVWTGHADSVKMKKEIKKDDSADLEQKAVASKIQKMTNLADILATTKTAREKVGEGLQNKTNIAPAPETSSKSDLNLPANLVGLGRKLDLAKASEKINDLKAGVVKVSEKINQPSAPKSNPSVQATVSTLAKTPTISESKTKSKYTQHLESKPEPNKTEDSYTQRVAEARQSLSKPKISKQQVVKHPAVHPSEVKAPIAKSPAGKSEPKFVSAAPATSRPAVRTDKLSKIRSSQAPVSATEIIPADTKPEEINPESKTEKIRQLQASVLKSPPVVKTEKPSQPTPQPDELSEGEEIQF